LLLWWRGSTLFLQFLAHLDYIRLLSHQQSKENMMFLLRLQIKMFPMTSLQESMSLLP